MKIGIQTCGSTGDIRPFIALAAELASVGHNVELVVTDIADNNYSDFADKFGFRIKHIATPVFKDPAELERVGAECIREKNFIKQTRKMIAEMFYPVVDDMYDAAEDLCLQNDLLIRHFFHYPAHVAAKRHGVPEVSVFLAHNNIPSKYTSPIGFVNAGKMINLLGWRVTRLVANKLFLKTANNLFTEKGLSPSGDMVTEVWPSELLNLVAVSPAFGLPKSDWPTNHHACGFFNMPDAIQETELPEEVRGFLSSGLPPVFVSLGSLTPTQPENVDRFVANFRKIFAQTGMRGIVQLPEKEARRFPGDKHFLCISKINHKQIFPACEMVIHHGGAGTTQTVLEAGIPSIVTPFLSDQFFWASEVKRLGVGLGIRRIHSQSTGSMANLIRKVMAKKSLRKRAKEIGLAMMDDNGVSKAVELINDVIQR